MKHAVTALTHTVLALRVGGHMRLLRQAFQETVMKAPRRIIRNQQPSMITMEKNRRTLDVVLPETEATKVAREALLKVLRGLWSEAVIVIYVFSDTAEDVVMTWLASILTVLLLSAIPSSFPGRSWTRCEEAPSCVGLIECIHRLWTPTFRRFCELAGSVSLVPKRHRVLALGAAEVAMPPLVDIDIAPEGDDSGAEADVEEGPGAPEEAVVVYDAEAEAQPEGIGPAQAAAEVDKNEQLRRENEKHRQIGLAWCLSGRVLVDCLLMCRILIPHARHMMRFMKQCSVDALRDKEAKAARNHRRTPSNPPPRREEDHRYLLQHAYDAESEAKLRSDLYKLMNDEGAFDAVPPKDRTEKTQTLTFGMIARGTSRIHAKICDLKDYPNKLLAITHHPELRPEISSDLKCWKRVPEWVFDIVQYYGFCLDNENFLAELEATLVPARRETIAVERNHSLIRRCRAHG